MANGDVFHPCDLNTGPSRHGRDLTATLRRAAFCKGDAIKLADAINLMMNLEHATTADAKTEVAT